MNEFLYTYTQTSAAGARYNFHPFFCFPLHFSFVFADNHVVEIKTISDFPPPPPPLILIFFQPICSLFSVKLLP